ncbi:MAG: carboxylating nicotinate-nucleotide diphosphorylase [Chitinivibrionia bacterium]|nr:carboxylating nicotinate-nucleotide diphosphorylase [Chitinivibrionia bacterium]
MNITIDPYLFDNLLKAAFREDLGFDINQTVFAGDITTKAIFDENTQVKSVIKAKENGILSGASIIEPTFNYFGNNCDISVLKSDGERLENGAIIAEISGKIHTILAAERIVLNFLQRLSGIATATNNLAQKISHTKAKVIDTRKTTPSLRFLEKQAVVHGGGQNHRFGLYDMILIKDTHVAAAGGPDIAVKKAKEKYPREKIEVEVQNLREFEKALSANPDRIMLDNMSVADMKNAVNIKNERALNIEIEASGNVNENTIAQIAEAGVDFISVGAITHSVKSLDIHLQIL